MSTEANDSKENIKKHSSLENEEAHHPITEKEDDKGDTHKIVKNNKAGENGKRKTVEGEFDDLDAPSKKVHTEADDNPFGDLNSGFDEEPDKNKNSKRRKKKGDEDNSDSEYHQEEEEEDYLEDDGEITSEHSERSEDFNLEDYLKFRSQVPDTPSDEEEGDEEPAKTKPKRKNVNKGPKKADEEEDEEDDDEEDEDFEVKG